MKKFGMTMVFSSLALMCLTMKVQAQDAGGHRSRGDDEELASLHDAWRRARFAERT